MKIPLSLTRFPSGLISKVSAAAFSALLLVSFEARAQTSVLFGETKVNQDLRIGENVVFSFTGAANQLVSINMTQVGGSFYPTFDLLSPTGAILRTVTDRTASRRAQLSRVLLPASGLYLLICRDADGIYGGKFNLTLIDWSGENPADNDKGSLTLGRTKQGTLVSSDIDIFSFSGFAGALVTIRLNQAGGSFYPTFDLVSPTGGILKTVTDRSSSRSAQLALFPLPESGTYLLACRDGEGIYSGTYSLFVSALTVDDSDNDGLPDSWEQQYFSDLRYGPDDDPDGDGLKNGDELIAKTDPSKADTDDDGFNDGVEVALGSDPLDPNSKPSTDMRIFVKTVDIEFLTLSGFRYQLQASRDQKTWVSLGDEIEGDNNLFRTNIDVRGTDYQFFIAPAKVAP